MAMALAIFAASGVYILHFFGISIGSFRIAGGLLLFLLSVDMLRAQPSRQRTTPEEMQEGPRSRTSRSSRSPSRCSRDRARSRR